MSIKRAFSISMALLGALVALFLVLAFASWNNQLELERRQRIHADAVILASELRRSSDLLTQSARAYAWYSFPGQVNWSQV